MNNSRKSIDSLHRIVVVEQSRTKKPETSMIASQPDSTDSTRPNQAELEQLVPSQAASSPPSPLAIRLKSTRVSPSSNSPPSDLVSSPDGAITEEPTSKLPEPKLPTVKKAKSEQESSKQPMAIQPGPKRTQPEQTNGNRPASRIPVPTKPTNPLKRPASMIDQDTAEPGRSDGGEPFAKRPNRRAGRGLRGKQVVPIEGGGQAGQTAGLQVYRRNRKIPGAAGYNNLKAMEAKKRADGTYVLATTEAVGDGPPGQ